MKFSSVFVECQYCKEYFLVKPSCLNARKFCSRKCQGCWKSENIKGKNHPTYNHVNCICKYCKTEFLVKYSHVKRRKYCSKKCRNHADKLKTGANNPLWKGPYKCIDCGIEIYKYSKRCLHCSHIGNNNPNWKGGISPECMKIRCSEKYKQIKIFVLKRDNYKCQMPLCKNNKKLEMHHIKKFSEYPDLRLDLSNLIILCKKCHSFIRRRESTYENLFYKIINKN